MRIRCIFLTKARTIEVKNISSSQDCFTFHGGTYSLDKEAVNLTSHSGFEVNPTPELFYIEDNPNPITVVNKGTYQFLEATLTENALRQLGGSSFGFLKEIIADYISNPWKLFILIMGIIVALAIIPELGSILKGII